MIGKVYKLHRADCEICYIGSTISNYTTVRLAHHRQTHRNGDKDYKGLFDGGDPIFTVLEEVPITGREEMWKVRQRERVWMEDTDNTINIKKAYLTQEEKDQQHVDGVSRYHAKPLGVISRRKATITSKIKQDQFDKKMLRYLNNEMKFLTELQMSIKALQEVDSAISPEA
tara:strand:+ start:290 stop:802 length:513 start_codon:yes stop_codon:yes gene_type:complete